MTAPASRPFNFQDGSPGLVPYVAAMVVGGLTLFVGLAMVLARLSIPVAILFVLAVCALRSSQIASKRRTELMTAAMSGTLDVSVGVATSAFSPIWTMNPSTVRVANGHVAVDGILPWTPIGGLDLSVSTWTNVLKIRSGTQTVMVMPMSKVEPALWWPRPLNKLLIEAINAAAASARHGQTYAPQAAAAQQYQPQAAPAQVTPPGWYPDPWGRANYRWWDGTNWSEHTQ